MRKSSLFPADIYQVINMSLLSEIDKLVLNMLYMPLIGNIAISLYLKLDSESYFNMINKEYTHHHLMTSMGLTLDNIKEARLKLEAIGLLKTYYHSDNVNSYVYELYSPVSPNEFFSHPIFNVVLYNNVGKDEYNKLYNFFKKPNVNLKDYEDISAPFDSVFKSRNFTSLEYTGEDIISKNKLLLSFELDFDFDLFSSYIGNGIFNSKCLNKPMKETIINLAFLYELDPVTMADIARSSLNEKGNIVKDELRMRARKYYQLNNNNRLPSLLFKSQPEYLKSASGDNTNRGRMIQVFENNSPIEFLKAKYKGGSPTSNDIKILENLLEDQKLNPAVINVLIDYVLKTNNNKLNKSYIETIAGHWKRSGIETASEAMAIAEKEHKKTSNNVPVKKKTSIPTPVWFDDKIESTSVEDDNEFNKFLEEFRNEKYSNK